MKCFFGALLLAATCHAASVRDFNPYAAASNLKCQTFYDTVAVERCEPYAERVCRTVQRENCKDVPDKNCRAIVTSKQVRKCFDVQEKICSLKEDVQYETVQVPTTVQKCYQDTERVCDTVFDTFTNRQEETQCINVEKPHCDQEEYTVQDKVCRTSTHFDCDSYGAYNYKVPNEYEKSEQLGGDVYDDGRGVVGNEYEDDVSYGVQEHSGQQQAYGQNAQDGKTYCKRRQEVKCYDTPRSVSVQRCVRRAEKVCERLSELVPYVQDKQSCHNDDKKICKLEHVTTPKKVKKYVYSKQCRSVPRKICENADVKQLVPSCVGVTRKECIYEPDEKCDEIQKKHCYKVFQKVARKKCQPVKYEQQQDGGYDASINQQQSAYDNQQNY